MKTAGVDFASKDHKTALCVIDWSSQRAIVEELSVGICDDEIMKCISKVNKLGIDVPLGWPTAFASAVGEYARGGAWPSDYYHVENEAFRLRVTDRIVRESVGGRPPLSVSADRIAIPAMRAAAMLSALSESSPRDGSGVVVEVYPAAALRRWSLDSRQYKAGKNAYRRQELVKKLLERAPWLTMNGSFLELMIENDDAFDAVVSALVARAKILNLVDNIPEEYRKTARDEGWIALPSSSSLAVLADSP